LATFESRDGKAERVDSSRFEKFEKSVLDKGFVRLADMMGDDYSAVKAARVSYGQGLKRHKRTSHSFYISWNMGTRHLLST